MKRLLLLAALAGGACAILAGAAAPAGAAGPAGTPAPSDGSITMATLTLNVTHVAFDQEANVNASVTVLLAGSFAPVPGGALTMRTFLANGTRVDLCTAALSGPSGSCHLANGQLPPGTYQLTAHYGGIRGLDEPADSPTKQLVVDSEPTSLFLALATNTLSYGQEGVPDEFFFQALPRTSGTPTGQVGVALSNQAGLCGANLAGGDASCTLAPTQVAPGTYQIYGFYDGDSTFNFSTTPLQTFTVVPGTVDTTLALSSPTIAFGSQQNEMLTSVVIPPGGMAGGSVAFEAGNETICSGSLVNADVARCSLTAGQLPAGTYQITAVYSGDRGFSPAFSPTQTLTVTN